jgi:hypothetical protein
MRSAAHRSMMLFASEVPVVSALNPYRQIEEVFLAAWKRTQPKQLAALQDELRVVVATPEEKMQAVVEQLGVGESIRALVEEAAAAETIGRVAQAAAQIESALPAATPAAVKQDVVQFVQSEMHKTFGAKHESPAILAYEAEQKVEVKERNAKFFKRRVARVGRYDLLVGGKIDGRADGKVIEVKNRVSRFMTPLPLYDVAQLQTYLFILRATDGELVEHLRNDRAQTKLTKVPWDPAMWDKQIAPFVVRFGSALAQFLEDRDAQVRFLTADEPAVQKEIIRHHWMLPMGDVESD